MILVYNLFIRLYVLGIRIAGLWSKKAREWIEGRRGVFDELSSKISKEDKIIWIHCASAGEFEQGKPVIEELKNHYPSYKILVSFFSPSGFAAAKKYQYADIISYLPADTRSKARLFVEIVHPSLVIFVKYEYWYHHLTAVAFRHIPLLLVSSIFRQEQVFFKWYGKFYRQMLFLFRRIFVQDSASLDLLQTINVHHSEVAGDTRFDRVKKIAEQFSELPLIKNFIGSDRVIVAGSTWSDDEAILESYLNEREIKLIVAPHEINEAHINEIEKRFGDSIRYSSIKSDIPRNARVLIIDNMGMLSKLYYYADVSYIGGGFNKSGIHNTLEAAVYGKPVIFGPNYSKFKEARELVANEAAFSVSTADDLKIKMDHLFNDPGQLALSGNAAKNYVANQTGATGKIMQYIQENRLLTS